MYNEFLPRTRLLGGQVREYIFAVFWSINMLLKVDLDCLPVPFRRALDQTFKFVYSSSFHKATKNPRGFRKDFIMKLLSYNPIFNLNIGNAFKFFCIFGYHYQFVGNRGTTY